MREALGAAMMLLASLSLRHDFLPAGAILDELIKVLASGDLPLTFTTLLNEIRHRLTWILFSLQLAGDLPNKLAQACNGVMASRTEGAANHSALCAIKPGYNAFSREAAAALRRGQFACCFSDASDPELAGKVFVIDVRDTCAMPGGQTRSATSEDGDSAE